MTEIKLGDSYYLTVSVKNADKTARDLSDVTDVLYQMAKSIASTTRYITKDLTSPDIVIEDPLDGVLSIKLQSDDTKGLDKGTAYHEAQMTLSNGDIITVLGEPIELIDQLIKGV